jgi:hypothetical protein
MSQVLNAHMNNEKKRNESTWVVTHLYMEAMLGIFLYSYS